MYDTLCTLSVHRGRFTMYVSRVFYMVPQFIGGTYGRRQRKGATVSCAVLVSQKAPVGCLCGMGASHRTEGNTPETIDLCLNPVVCKFGVNVSVVTGTINISIALSPMPMPSEISIRPVLESYKSHATYREPQRTCVIEHCSVRGDMLRAVPRVTYVVRQ